MAKPPRKSPQPPLSEEDKQRRHAVTEKIVDGIKTVLVTGIGGFFLWKTAEVIFYWPVQASAGQETTISVFHKLIADFNLHVAIAWGAAAAAAAWGYSERKQKMRERTAKDQRTIELEKKIDPTRTSSGLTTEGKVKKDKK